MMQDTSADLAFLKRMVLAGRGRAAPALVLMAVFGLAYGVAFLLTAATMLVGVAEVQASPLWPALRLSFLFAHGAFLIALGWTAWRFIGPNRAALSRAAAAVWSGAFIAFVIATASMMIFTRDQSPADSIYAAYLYKSFLLVLWGLAWWATALLTERRWLLGVAGASFAAAVIVAWIGNTAPLLWAISACLLLLAFLPAMILLNERRT